MDYRKALRLLQLPDDTSVQSAEAQFATLSQQLGAQQAALAETSEQWQALADELSELTEAIEAVRQPRSSIERAGAALLAGYARERRPSGPERSHAVVDDHAEAETAATDLDAPGGPAPVSASEALPADMPAEPSAEVANARALDPESGPGPETRPRLEPGFQPEPSVHPESQFQPEPGPQPEARPQTATTGAPLDEPCPAVAEDPTPPPAAVESDPAPMPPASATLHRWPWALLLATLVAALVYRLATDGERPLAIEQPSITAVEESVAQAASGAEALSAAERDRLEEDRARLQSWAAQLVAALGGPPPAVSPDQWSQLTRRHVPQLDRLVPTAAVLEAAAAEAVTAANVEERRRMLDSAGDLLDAQSTALTALFEAVRARSAAEEQWQRLDAGSLALTAGTGDASAGVGERLSALDALRDAAATELAAGDLSLAAQRYRALTAELTAIAPELDSLAEQREREIERLYNSGMEAIERYHLSRPEEGSALEAARRIETLSPGRQETAALMAAIRDAYVRLLQAALLRDDLERAERYATLAVQLGVSSAIIDEVYRSADVAAP